MASRSREARPHGSFMSADALGGRGKAIRAWMMVDGEEMEETVEQVYKWSTRAGQRALFTPAWHSQQHSTRPAASPVPHCPISNQSQRH